MAAVTGFEQLQRQLAEAKSAMSTLDGEIGEISFDSADQSSIEAAVRTMELMVDQKAGRYSSNPLVGPLIAKSKEAFAAAIRAKASYA